MSRGSHSPFFRGVTAKTGVDIKNEQGLGADSTLFVEAPLDIMMAYYFRAKKQCSQLPFGERLQWLESRDLEERSEWVARYRESTRSLGSIVKEVFAARDAHWIPAAVAPGPSVKTEMAKTAPPAGTSGGTSLFQLGPPIGGKQVAKVMKTGERLCCYQFQLGKCQSRKQCQGGAHRCGHVTKGERVCGSPGHGAANWKTKAKA